MKFNVINVIHQSGISEKSGSPKSYDMSQLSYLTDFEPVENAPKMVRHGSGMVVETIDCPAALFPHFQKILNDAKGRFPLVLDIDVVPGFRGRLKIVGLVPSHGTS